MAHFLKLKNYFGFGEVVDDSTTPYTLIAAGTTNATVVKAGPGVLASIVAINVNAAVRYLKFYDTDKAPTAGSGTPVRRYPIPANTTGAGFVLAPGLPMRFNRGIAFTMTTGVADNDVGALTANDVILTLEYI